MINEFSGFENIVFFKSAYKAETAVELVSYVDLTKGFSLEGDDLNRALGLPTAADQTSETHVQFLNELQQGVLRLVR